MNLSAVYQILIVLVLAVGGFYLGKYFGKIKVKPQDLDIVSLIETFFQDNLLTDETAKKIAGIIGTIVQEIKVTMANSTEQEKEDAIYSAVVQAIQALNLDKALNEIALRQVIKLVLSFLDQPQPQPVNPTPAPQNK